MIIRSDIHKCRQQSWHIEPKPSQAPDYCCATSEPERKQPPTSTPAVAPLPACTRKQTAPAFNDTIPAPALKDATPAPPPVYWVNDDYAAVVGRAVADGLDVGFSVAATSHSHGHSAAKNGGGGGGNDNDNDSGGVGNGCVGVGKGVLASLPLPASTATTVALPSKR